MAHIPPVQTLEKHPEIFPILQAALAAADPAQALTRVVRREGSLLIAAGQLYELAHYRRVRLLSMGKAAIPLARPLIGLLDGFLSGGLVVGKTVDGWATGLPGSVRVLQGGHPIPDERSLQAGSAVLEFLGDTTPDDLLVCAVSGGASALVAAPFTPLGLADLQPLTARLLAGGAGIDEINTLRRHLDRLKGGGCLRQTGATVLGLILSDVIGNSLEAIASGPTAPDPSTRQDAIDILQKYLPRAELTAALTEVLAGSPETLKPGDARFANVRNQLIGSNLLAIQAGLKEAQAQGFHPYLLRADLRGEAREAAGELCHALRWACQRAEPVARPFCMLAGGETTVTLRGDGRGGRNTELALAAVVELAGFPDVMLVTLATDGEDGPTDAAGAVVTGESWRRAEILGMHPVEFLGRNDSYAFFAALDDLIKTGPTGTNVNDLVFLFGF